MKVTLTIKIEPDVLSTLKETAKKQERTVSYLVRKAVEAYLKNYNSLDLNKLEKKLDKALEEDVNSPAYLAEHSLEEGYKDEEDEHWKSF